MAHNLPLELASLIGRRQDTAEVLRSLSRTRLLTLTGAGGIGKTRLALRAVADVVGTYAHGVWLIELAGIPDGALIPQAGATIFGVREASGMGLVEQLVQALAPKHALLLLDNCEDILPACAELASKLLRACPDVSILATSRESMNIAGELCFSVPALGTPGPTAPASEIAESEAVELFVERAQAALPGFMITDRNGPALAQICRQLDGIPLALELAAARIKVLAPEEIASRLEERLPLLTSGSRSAPRRQQTIRAAIDWSYDLLTEQERAVFERLAVFAGGWTTGAAEAVLGANGIAESDVLDLLARLAGKSLILIDQSDNGLARHRLLETIREYARERLVEHGEYDTVAGRHATYFTDVAEEAQAVFSARLSRWR